MSTPGVEIEITQSVTDVTVSNTSNTAITVDTSGTTSVSVNPIAIPTQAVIAGNVTLNATGTVTATNVQDAIAQLAAQQFRGTTAPTAGTTNLEEGDFFYDTDDDQLKVYRETSPGTFEFVPIMVGNISPDSDTVDAGSY